MANITDIEIATPVPGSSASAVSWAAIFAGAVAAAATTLILLAITSGLGFAAVSPWPNSGVSGTTFTLLTAAWLIAVHAIASSVGGYMAGRLRTKWTSVHTDEVFFRDTAHGFLSWATGMIAGALLLGSLATSAIGTGAQAGANLLAGVTQGATAAAASSAGSNTGSSGIDPTAYFVDALFRTDRPAPDANDQSVRVEIGRILANAVRAGELPPADRTYVAQVVATRTGVPQADAERRVDEMVNNAKQAMSATSDRAKQAAETARKGATYAALWMSIAMLIGALCSSAFAAFAGGLRDD